MSQIKERPILFSAPQVSAILEGRKTVTRRAVKVQPHIDASGNFCVGSSNYGQDGYGKPVTKHFVNGCCPYGKPGDRLWVRETWARIRVAQAPDQEWVVYRECDNRTDYGGPWKPGIHMFRRDSRILLEITDVRVERLQDISEEQALAEGIIPHVRGGWHWHPHDPANVDDWHQFGFKTPVWAFHDLWAGINGQENWDANPWVWVVEFKRVTP
ncbi:MULTISPECIES: hypothetical protein [unclassified Pseudomonas]|uniref:hypothetical protein n=1 Tax=unclassified Pseudomonas TaxID=196821 RepID=UPI00160F5A86|nr:MULTISPECIES: hypothetical protein [unclassified Pseudomonas]MBB6286101.1 hypothetical protein [Pseudomonas sp. SJZ073]MBB6311975.1 hypothetical protein [Pseudomonas sp. JAI120]